MRKAFLAEFGTTLRGLMHHHDVLPGDYLEFVHDVPIPEIVPPRPELREMLSGLPGRCVVFTNGSEEYAGRVLDALGVAEMMEGIYGIEFMEYIAKPSPYPYAKLLRVTGARGEDSLFCEDSRKNLLPALELGMFTVWVGGNEKESPAHAVVQDVCDLPDVLHGFPPMSRWNGGAARGASGNGCVPESGRNGMTEGKPKRSYWRRGPRKKKVAEDAAGTAAATPQAAEGEDPAPESEAAETPETGETFAPPPAPEFEEETVVDAGPAEAPAEGAEGAPAPAKGRRRSRRRGKKKPGDATAPEPAEGSGETPGPGGGTPGVRSRGVGRSRVARPRIVRGPGGRRGGAGGGRDRRRLRRRPLPGPRRSRAESRESPGSGAAAGAVAAAGRGKGRRRARPAARPRRRPATRSRRRAARGSWPRAARRPRRRRTPAWRR